jgi:hypothetical protein
MKKHLQVTMEVSKPSIVDLTVQERVQVDRVLAGKRGPVAQRHGALIDPGTTTLELAQGRYSFKAFSEARLRVVSGGVSAVATNATKPGIPEPPPMSANGAGDEPEGDAPSLHVS